jgi:hypothetical protein
MVNCQGSRSRSGYSIKHDGMLRDSKDESISLAGKSSQQVETTSATGGARRCVEAQLSTTQ